MPQPPNTFDDDKQSRGQQIQAAVLCGIINGIITIPVMTSFAAIIFQVMPNQCHYNSGICRNDPSGAVKPRHDDIQCLSSASICVSILHFRLSDPWFTAF